MVCIHSETPLEKIIFSFGRRYQLEMASGLEMDELLTMLTITSCEFPSMGKTSTPLLHKRPGVGIHGHILPV